MRFIVAHVNRMNADNSQIQLAGLLRVLPDHTFAHVTCTHITPHLLAEATLQALGDRDTGVLKSSTIAETPVVLKRSTKVGPLAIVRVCLRSQGHCDAGMV